MGALAYDMRRIMAFAEQGIGVMHDVIARFDQLAKESAAIHRRMDELAAAFAAAERDRSGIAERMDAWQAATQTQLDAMRTDVERAIIAALGAATPDHGNVVEFPSAPTQVYQLGIEEGIRRANRERSN
jgi:hypothetical protein